MGRPLSGIVDNRQLFEDLATSYFLDAGGGRAFVALDAGMVAGYIFVAPSDREQTAYNFRYYVKRIALELLRPWRFTRNDVKYYLGETAAFLRGDFRFPSFDDYPSALHINVAAGSRRSGLGSSLFNAMFRCLEEAGSNGVHLKTTSGNFENLNFLRKQGFEILASKKSGFYAKYGFPDVENIVFGKRLKLST